MQWEPTTNTGYAKYRAEVLNDQRMPDEKETFNVRKDSLYTDRDYFENVKRKKEWKEVTKRFYDKCERACESLCLATAVALGFEEKDARFFADTFREMDLCTLKFLHSMPTKPSLETSENTVGNRMSLRVSEHVDFGFATFLFHDSESLGRGLQVKKSVAVRSRERQSRGRLDRRRGKERIAGELLHFKHRSFTPTMDGRFLQRHGAQSHRSGRDCGNATQVFVRVLHGSRRRDGD